MVGVVIRRPLLLASALIAALFLAWELLVAMNFSYPLWYQALHIDETIRVYGPQNRNRHGFENTTATEHARLFAAIVDAVEDGGRGLEQLEYRDAQGRPLGRLLTTPEIVHLKDVARLVHLFHLLGWTALLSFIAIALSLQRRPAAHAPVRKYLAYTAAIAVIAASVLAILGPKTVFYTLHTWVFPAGHQWFFYYQDSLMTTLMQAPVLFAGIAAEWLLLTLVIFVPLVLLATHRSALRLTANRSPVHHQIDDHQH